MIDILYMMMRQIQTFAIQFLFSIGTIWVTPRSKKIASTSHRSHNLYSENRQLKDKLLQVVHERYKDGFMVTLFIPNFRVMSRQNIEHKSDFHACSCPGRRRAREVVGFTYHFISSIQTPTVVNVLLDCWRWGVIPLITHIKLMSFFNWTHR